MIWFLRYNYFLSYLLLNLAFSSNIHLDKYFIPEGFVVFFIEIFRKSGKRFKVNGSIREGL